jgi:hypothetical protein
MSKFKRKNEITVIELAVLLLAVDDVESIWQVSLHVADFKVEPLMVFGRIHVWHQDQVIFQRSNLRVTIFPCIQHK